jgi:hypothetical protein
MSTTSSTLLDVSIAVHCGTVQALRTVSLVYIESCTFFDRQFHFLQAVS